MSLRIPGAACLTRLTRLTELVLLKCLVSDELGYDDLFDQLTISSEVRGLVACVAHTFLLCSTCNICKGVHAVALVDVPGIHM
jgi:hypothetical protein